MIVEDNEVKEMWCPFVRPPPQEYKTDEHDWGGTNRITEFTHCLGIHCMAYRHLNANEDQGYCGLAGIPYPQEEYMLVRDARPRSEKKQS